MCQKFREDLTARTMENCHRCLGPVYEIHASHSFFIPLNWHFLICTQTMHYPMIVLHLCVCWKTDNTHVFGCRDWCFQPASNDCVLILCSFHRHGRPCAMSKSFEVLLLDIKSRYMLGSIAGGREKYFFSCHFFSVIGVWSKERTDLIFRSAQHPHIPVKLMRSAGA